MINWPTPEYWAHMYPELFGQKRLQILHVASVTNPVDHAIIYANSLTEPDVGTLKQKSACLLILHERDRQLSEVLAPTHGMLFSDDPRYHFAQVLAPLWSASSLRGPMSHDRSRDLTLGSNVIIHSSATIEPGVTIASNSVIGAGAYVMSGARLGPKTIMGENAVVRENSVIGGWGFGFAQHPGKPTIRIPHVGGVVIGDEAEIGALTTVCSGTIEPTVIADRALINDHVHIGHNCKIESGAMVGVCASVSGSTVVKQGAWLSPHSAIIDRISVGEDAMVGIGAVVLRSVPERTTVVGNPARPIERKTHR